MDVNANTYSDYLMLISPPDRVSEVIGKYKKATFKHIGSFDGLYSTPHISLTTQLRQMPVMMTQKLEFYQRSVNRLPAIPLYINGFSYFTNEKAGMTIYAKIEMNGHVEKWFGELRKALGGKQKIVPHITIAKSLSPEYFQRLWPKFINQQYQFEFTPQSITVLSRPMIGSREKIWTPFKELHFNNFY